MSFFKQVLPIKLVAAIDFRCTSGHRANNGRPFFALSYRLSGDSTFIHDGESFHAGVGDVTFVPKDYKYELDSAEDEHLIAIHFDVKDRSFVPDGLEFMTPANPAAVEKLFRSVCSIWNYRRPGCEYAATAEFCRLLSELQRQSIEPKALGTNERFGVACEHMFKNFTDASLTVEALADMAGISTAYFRRLFKDTYGESPIKYLSNLRTDYAAELLRSGYFSVENVAEMAGFNDPKYFSVVVKQRYGQPPSKLK